MEDLNGLWQRLSLSETEEDRFILEPTKQSATHILAAKFFTRRVINVEAVTRTFRPLWRSENGFSARDMGDNIMIFEFEDEADLKRVLMAEPWSYDKILSLKKEVAVSLGRSIGEVLTTTDSDEELGGGRVMRIRVKVNINKPLCRGRKIGLANGKDSWAAFRYERLPNFCYWCGMLTHGEKDCDFWLRNHSTLRQEDQAYGAWLRAPGNRPYRKVEIHVAGRAQNGGTVKASRGVTDEVVVDLPAGKEPVNVPERQAEKNPGSTPDLGKSDRGSFEEKLKEIDKEMGFLNENLGELKNRRRLVPSPAGTNELLKLELSWAWEPMYSSRTYPVGAGASSLGGVLIETWNLLRRLNQQFLLPWCCIGDFNEIVKNEEMHGRNRRPDRQMQGFRDAMDECDLMDLGYRGSPFTWCNNRDPPATTWVRLDRGLATLSWVQKFPAASVEHLDVINSDHKCLLLTREPRGTQCFQRKPFRFKEVWTSDEGCENTIQAAWGSAIPGSAMFKVAEKLKTCKKHLGDWSRRSFGSVTRQLREKKQELAKAEEKAIKGGSLDRIRKLKAEVNFLLEREERLWRQRSRVMWLSEGDRNTRYFHGRASQRRRRNKILGLKDEDGVWREDKVEVAGLIMQYFDNIFRTSLPENIEEAVAHVPNLISKEGDPISPYLFLLCAEGLHYLISNAKDRGSLQGTSLCRNGPKITHLFFADDCLLFSKATSGDCATIQEILTTYEKASGQQVNREKTAIFFSKATPMTSQNAIKDSLGVPIIRQYEKYLGLPSLVGRHKVESFSHIKERVWSKIKGWKGQILSQAGREIMIKAVAQAVPTYAMSCFRLPIRLCQEIEAMIRKFWWSQGQDQNKICWVKWNSLCHPKGVGGMGFREMRKFNDALLGKQVWRLLKNTSSLFHRVFKAKFFPNGTLLDAKSNRRDSYAWQSILKARDNILKGAAWRVGDGKTIKIWRDKWLLEDHHQKIVFPGPAVLAESTVSQLFIPNVQRWDDNLIDKLFHPYDAAAIKCIPLSNRVTKDDLVSLKVSIIINWLINPRTFM
uniref:Reverse transcriptase domain-containing protein n=1 Tax=Fagus sylvatica TaxID=28930 RepID=A0A2N9HDU2_FAGSY